MKILRETVRKIDWGLVALIAIVPTLVFFAARYGSVSRDSLQTDEIKRVEQKLDELVGELREN